MSQIKLALLPLLFLLPAICRAQSSQDICGQVVDADSRKPIERAWVVSGESVTRTNREGRFSLHQKGSSVGIRAVGYSRLQLAPRAEMQIILNRLHVRGLYLSFWGVSSPPLRTGVLETVTKAHLNAIVIDIKGDRGFISHPTHCALAWRPEPTRSSRFAIRICFLQICIVAEFM